MHRFNKTDCSKGGQNAAKVVRNNALIKYYKNPNICLYCNSIIDVPENKKPSTIKKKKFCNCSCSAKYTHIKHTEKIQNANINGIKIETISSKKTLIGRTKKQLFDSSINWQAARSIIQRHARTVFKLSDRQKCCFECGYDKHYEVCHKKSVSSFSDEANIVDEINHIDNLIALCPNHHWEFDNKILKFK